MRSFLLIPVVLFVACGPDAEDDVVKALKYALTAVEAPASAPVTSSVGVAATVTATPTGTLALMAGAQTVEAPAAGVLVNFRVVSGGGTVWAGAALTNSEGIAREQWTLGTAAGDQVLEARGVNPDNGEPILYGQPVVTRATPGEAKTFGWAPSVVTLNEWHHAWDHSELRRVAWDQHFNRIDDLPQGTITFVRTYWEGRTYGGAPPPGECTVTGTLITCPREKTCFVGTENYCYFGQFFAEFATDWPERSTVAVLLDQPS